MDQQHIDTPPNVDANAPTNQSPQPLRRPRRNRTDAIESYYKAAYGQLRAAIYGAEPGLYFNEAERVLSILAAELSNYTGRTTEKAFLSWAKAFVTEQAHGTAQKARRIATAIKIMEDHSALICAVIKRTMPHGLQDCAIGIDDLKQEVSLRILAIADDLADADNPKNTAKLSTRLYAIVKRHVELYVTPKLRRRFNLILTRIEQGDTPYGLCATLSAAEHKAMRAANRRESEAA